MATNFRRSLAFGLTILLLIPGLAFAAKCTNQDAGFCSNSQTGAKDFCQTIRDESRDVVNDKCGAIVVQDGQLTESGGAFILRSGPSQGGYTSMTSAETTVSTSYSLILKAINAPPLFQTGTLGDGRAGQLLTIQITAVGTNGTWTLTPSRKTGFTSVVFDTVGDRVTFLYVDNTVGWVIVAMDTLTSDSGWTLSGSVVSLSSSSNNVGIGTSVPVAKLDIDGNIGIGTTGAKYILQRTTTANQTIDLRRSNGDYGSLAVEDLYMNGNLADLDGTPSFEIEDLSDLIGTWKRVEGISVWNINGENVGIGTSVPGALLEINGDLLMREHSGVSSGRGACWDFNGRLGHCDSDYDSNGDCTCVAP